MSHRDRQVTQLQHHMDGAQTSSKSKLFRHLGKTDIQFLYTGNYTCHRSDAHHLFANQYVFVSGINLRKSNFFQIGVFIFDR
jgi:hypothetical protein